MTRLPGASMGPGRKPAPDVYSILLLVGILFLLTACIVAFLDLKQTYGLSFGGLFSGAKIPK